MPPALMAGAGIGMMGMGSMVSAFGGGPSMPPQIDPEVAATLQQQGIDVQQMQAMANAAMQAQQAYWGQATGKYGAEYGEALQRAYQQGYGPLEEQARTFAQSALAGQQTPLTQQMIANYQQQVGQQGQAGQRALGQQLAQSGIDPRSALAQRLMAEQQMGTRQAGLAGAAQIGTQMGQFQLPYALNILGQGMTSQRLSGLQPPAIPQTAMEAGIAPIPLEPETPKEREIPKYYYERDGKRKEKMPTYRQWIRRHGKTMSDPSAKEYEERYGVKATSNW